MKNMRPGQEKATTVESYDQFLGHYCAYYILRVADQGGEPLPLIAFLAKHKQTSDDGQKKENEKVLKLLHENSNEKTNKKIQSEGEYKLFVLKQLIEINDLLLSDQKKATIFAALYNIERVMGGHKGTSDFVNMRDFLIANNQILLKLLDSIRWKNNSREHAFFYLFDNLISSTGSLQLLFDVLGETEFKNLKNFTTSFNDYLTSSLNFFNTSPRLSDYLKSRIFTILGNYFTKEIEYVEALKKNI